MPKPTLTPDEFARLSDHLSGQAEQIQAGSIDFDGVIVLGIQVRDGRIRAFDGHSGGVEPLIDHMAFIFSQMALAYAQQSVIVSDEDGGTEAYNIDNI